MNWFWNLSLRHKLTVVIMLVSLSAMLLACVGFIGFEYYATRKALVHDLSSLTDVLALNSRAALRFQDKMAAETTLASMQAKPNILSASLYTSDRKVFATWSRDPAHKDARVDAAPQEGYRFERESLRMCQPAVHDGEKIGYVCLESDLREITDRVRLLAGISFLVLIIAGLAALGLSAKLPRVVTKPILGLAETARLVGEKHDYSVRSDVTGRSDEIGVLANAFNHMLHRIQSQDSALSLSQQKLESLVHSIDGIVWERDPKTLAFTFVSQQSMRILGYPPESWLGNSRFWEKIVHPDDVDKAAKASLEAQAKCEAYDCEYRVIASDKRVVWIRESGVVRVENDKPVALRGILQDITKQKQAAGELERLNHRLVDASRQAGMAEVATGILHNVGNVLNSVNVSATLVQDQMVKSKLLTLERATGLLREHLSDAGAFIANDPKGRLLPDFLIKVTELALEEQHRWQEELKGLRKNIEHMKEIVAMQQSYARVAGIIEAMSAEDLVEDALRINAASLARHDVEVVRAFNKVPKVKVDKHKVVQILINLVRNAKYALDAARVQQRLLTIHIGRNGSDRVKIIVQDNGIGIPKENLTNIFSHGFTTKRDGHGFGLHSSALAAKELGGSLTAHSDGPGTGATFTLELPIANSIN
jgi:PAS domain S-box-containing protein